MRNLVLLVAVAAAGCMQEFVPLHHQSGGSAPAGGGTGGNGAGIGGSGAGTGGSGGGGAGGASGNTSGGGAGGTTAGGSDGGATAATGDGGAAVAGDGGADPNCIARATPAIDGHHNQGLACLDCHDGNTATKFFAGGTVYDGAGNGLAGVTVEVSDGKSTLTVVTAAQPAGNFYFKTALTAPLKVRASGCPFDRPMIAAAATGNCNSAGCHDPARRIRVP